jgi:outer membrane protein insertion porin family
MMSMVCSRNAPYAFIVLCLCSGPWCALGADASLYEGKRITDIQFSPPNQPVDSLELEDMLPVKKGSVLSLVEVRASLERLFATGAYQDISVDAELSGDGVVLRFITRNSWFVGRVSASGTVSDPPNAGQLVGAAGLDLGQPFREDDLQPAITGLNSVLTENGFYQHHIEPRIEYDSQTQQAHVHFEITAGPRATYREAELNGTLELTPAEIIGATRWRRFLIGGWRTVNANRTRKGLDRIRSRYENRDRFLASVQLKQMDYDAASRSISPKLVIEAGPKIVVRAVGAKIGSGQLKRDIPVYEEHSVDQDLLAEGQRNLRDELQSQGYFEAAVEFEQRSTGDNEQEIEYKIEPGTRHTVVELDITGNRYFTSATLRERMLIQPKSFQSRRGRFSDALRRRDEESIADVYRQNGFRDVVVTASVEDNYRGKTGNLGVHFKVSEGVQWLVSKLDFTGFLQLDASSLLPALSSSVGQPYSEFNVAADRDAILVFYFTNGFPNASFEWSSTPGPQPHQVDLRYIVHEGPRQFVRGVLLEGLDTTRRSVVNRKVRIAAGDPLSPIRMAETQRRLYDLGVFATVDMAIQNPDGDNERKYVVYEVEEAKKYSVSTGFGAEIARIGGSQTSLDAPAGQSTFVPRVSFDVTRLNVLGLGHTLSFRTRFSTLERRGLITYVAPQFRNHENFDLSFTALYDETQDYHTFSARRLEGSVQLAQRLSKPSSFLYRFSYRRVSTYDLKINYLLVPLLSQPARVGMLSGTYIQDRRDDPINSHRGIYNTVDLGLASKGFGSQINFVRGLARNATYHQVSKHTVLARELSFGAMFPFDLAPGVSADTAIPFPELFFGGGGGSNRAFPENQAGPRDPSTGFPVGGRALLFHKTEWRFPLFGENIGGVLFHDMGNVYTNLSSISFRTHQRDLTDFDYMVHAVGFGIRYRTPVGPLRLDLAYGLNSPRFFGCKGNLDDLLACSEPNNVSLRTDQRITRIQFVFSIGQAF